MNKYIPDYLEEFSEAFQTFNEGLKEVCKKLDLLIEAVDGVPDLDELDPENEKTAEADNNEELISPEITFPKILPARQVILPNEDNEDITQDSNADNKETTTPKKRGRKPKE